MPLMRELEFPAKRNFLTELRNRKQYNDSGYAKGMFEVDTTIMSNLMYVGNDAVHTLGIGAFHAPIQEEINKRMSLMNGDKDGSLRFAPLSLNAELEKNTNMILELTGMDQVCHFEDVYLAKCFLSKESLYLVTLFLFVLLAHA